MFIMLPMFGSFERNELYKFLRLGLLFSLIIGVYWALGMLKQAIFCNLVGAAMIPYARVVSMIGTIFVLMYYTKLLDCYPRDKIFYMISLFYAIGIGVFSLLLYYDTLFLSESYKQFFAYSFAFFCDGYAILIGLFWAIVTDSTLPESAKKGFSLIVAVGQLGGIFLPPLITRLPVYFLLTTHAVSVAACVLPVIVSMYALRNYILKTPSELLRPFRGINEQELVKPVMPGFFEGLRLVAGHAYLIGIFCVVVFPDILATIFDMHFNMKAAQQFPGVALAGYFGNYGSAVNTVTLLFLLLGINNITRKLGIGVALILMPLLFVAAIVGFIALDSLDFLFCLMVAVKAVNYALSVPAIKQLYIPTLHNTRFKAQAWIDAFGPHTSKLSGSLFNMLLQPLQISLGFVAGRARHVLLSTYFGVVLIAIWLAIAFGLGKTHKHAVEQNKVIC
jgi:AAA family ATP:ADP antiporter